MDADDIARSLVESLAEGDFNRASQQFSQKLRTQLPPQRLALSWQMLERAFGSYVGIRGSYATEHEAGAVVSVQLTFERQNCDALVTTAPEDVVVGLFFRPAKPTEESDSNGKLSKDRASLRRKTTVAALFILLSQVLAMVLLFLSGVQPDLMAFLLGSAGWIAALGLRIPAGRLLRAFNISMSRSAAHLIVSGPTEELVRLLIVRALSPSIPSTLWLGVGWASAEALFVVTAGQLAIRRVRSTELAAGISSKHVWFGLAERTSVTAFHVGATTLITFSMLWAVILMPVHSALNVSAVNLARRSLILSELIVAAIGLTVLATGLALIANAEI